MAAKSSLSKETLTYILKSYVWNCSDLGKGENEKDF